MQARRWRGDRLRLRRITVDGLVVESVHRVLDLLISARAANVGRQRRHAQSIQQAMGILLAAAAGPGVLVLLEELKVRIAQVDHLPGSQFPVAAEHRPPVAPLLLLIAVQFARVRT